MRYVTVRKYSKGFDINKEIIDEICVSLNSIDIDLRKYIIKDFKQFFPIKLKECGWSDSISIDKRSKISITSMKDSIGLCLQTGNVSRIYADLIKLEALYKKDTINAGIIIIPTSNAAKAFGGNIATLERLERELPIFEKVITLPLFLIGFDN